MGTGYTRNDTANNIADGNIINAADLDGEFDAIEAAFATTGHTHDGTAAEGGAILVLGPSQEFVVSSTEAKPSGNAGLSLGTNLLQFNDLWLDGTAYIDGLGESILVDTNAKIQFRDTALFINSSADGQLDLEADTTIELTAPTVSLTNDLKLKSDASVLYFGADDDVSVTHVADVGLKMKSSSGLSLALQTSDTTIESGNRIGRITFNAPDEASGTDAIVTGASIEAIAEATFDSTTNSTALVFKTNTSGAAAERMRLTSDGNLRFLDNRKATFGGADDLQIYHDGQHSYVTDQGTGRLYLQGTANITLTNADATAEYANFANGGAVSLRYDNAVKLATTSTGAEVTGTLLKTDNGGNVEVSVQAESGGSDFRRAEIFSGGSVPVTDGVLAGLRFYNGQSSLTDDVIAGINAIRGTNNNKSSLIFSTSGTSEAMRITDTQNVIVGSDSTRSVYKHTVANVTGVARIFGIASGGVDSLHFDQARGSVSAPTASNADGDGSYLSFSSYDGTNWDDIGSLAVVTDGQQDAGRMIFRTTPTGGAQTERMRIDQNGRVTIGGISAAAWGSAYDVLHVGSSIGGAVYAGSSNAAFITNNAYNDNSSWKYSTSAQAAAYTQYGGTHTWQYAGSGTANNNITWNTALKTDSSGRILLGNTNTTLAIGGFNPQVQLQGTVYNQAAHSASLFSNNSDPALLLFSKSRGTSIGSYTIVQDGDNIGNINWNAADGVDLGTYAARISGQVDGTAAANDIPGRLVFYTALKGAGSISERMRIDNQGNVTIGDSTRQPMYNNVTVLPHLQLSPSNGSGYVIGTANAYSASASNYGQWVGAKSRSSTVGSHVVVENGDALALFGGQGSDGSQFVEAASIRIHADGTASANDVPGRLEFHTTADGAAAGTERMRITSAGDIDFYGSSGSPVVNFDRSEDGFAVYNSGTFTHTNARYSVRTSGNAAYSIRLGVVSGTGSRVRIKLLGSIGYGDPSMGEVIIDCGIGNADDEFKTNVTASGSFSTIHTDGGVRVYTDRNNGTSYDVWLYVGTYARFAYHVENAFGWTPTFDNASGNGSSIPATAVQTEYASNAKLQQDELMLIQANNTEIARFNSDGLKFPSGRGIDFSASEGSGASSSLLDDYEEGSFTPNLEGDSTAGDFVYTHQAGWYTKVGNLVTAHINIAAYVDGTGTAPVGSLLVTGLPFTANAESVGSFQCNDMANSYQSNVGQYTAVIQSSNTHLHYRGTRTDGGAHHTMAAQSMSYLRSTISYTTNS